MVAPLSSTKPFKVAAAGVIEVAACVVTIGAPTTVTSKLYPILLQLFAFSTVSVPVYTFEAAAPGTVNGIGLPGKEAAVTLPKPAVVATGFQVILYSVGEFVVALYGRLAVVVP